jgi:signal transduction histidine kinase
MNLVNLYRTKVGKESEVAKEAKEDYERWEEVNSRFAEEDFANGESVSFGVYGTGSHTEIWTNHLMVNEQLIGHFYAKVAGEGADQKVLAHFLPKLYDTSIYSEEEENFLTSHFQEMVNYIIQTPCNDLEYVHRYDTKDMDLIPNEVLSLIKYRVNLPAGAVVYNPFAGYGQFACVFKDCHFYCEESYSAFAKEWNDFCDKCFETTKETHEKVDVDMQWAWLKVALFANNLDAKIIDDSCVPSDYDAFMAFIPFLQNSFSDSTIGGFEEQSISPKLISIIRSGYKNLRRGGDMILIVPNKSLWDAEVDKPFGSFWKELIEDHAMVEVIQLPSVMSQNLFDDYCIIIAKKDSNSKCTTMIDARFAEIHGESLDVEKLTDIRVNELLSSIQIDGEKGYVLPNKSFPYVLDINAIEAMIQNEGKELATGLRKMAIISHSDLKAELLFPQIYVIEKPNENESPRPLSDLCMPVNIQIADTVLSISGNIPWVKSNNLSATYQGPLDTTQIDNIGESLETKEHISKDMSRWGIAPFSKDDYYSYVFRRCTYVDGKNDTVVFYPTKKGVVTALLRSGDTPIAIDKGLFVLQPKRGINTEDLLAIISMPIVWRQMMAYIKFGLYNHLDDILVPTDKRIIQDGKHRLLLEESASLKLKEKLEAKKTEYINEVRMRKHDMGQYIFELINIEDLIRYYIENRETETDYYKQIEDLLDDFRSSLGELSTLLDNLSKEEQFGKPELFNLNEFLSHFTNRHKADGFKINYYLNDSSIKRYYHKLMQDDSIEEAIVNAQIQDYEEDMTMEDAMVNAQIKEYEEGIAMEEAMINTQMEAHEEGIVMENAIVNAQIQAHEDELYETNVVFRETDDRDKKITPNDARRRNYFIPSLFVAQNDIQRLISNIVDNARKHGFTDPNRKDYEINVALSIDIDNNMFQIDFRNNGNPLPEGMNKMRYGLKGEKAGITAGTGLGGNYVKSFVEHYGGDYDVFMDDGWTVVRIYLPIKCNKIWNIM